MIPRLTSLWRNLFHKDKVDQEFSQEIQAYLDLSTEANLRQGLSPQEARRNALLELGGVEQVEERVREIRMCRFIETVWRDVRTGVRALCCSYEFIQPDAPTDFQQEHHAQQQSEVKIKLLSAKFIKHALKDCLRY